MLPTFSPSLSILHPAMSLCWLHTHMLNFFILETSRYTKLTGSNSPTLMLGELKLFISLFPTSWNKSSNILHVFLIVMTMQQTLLTHSLLLTLRTILTLSPLLWDPLTIVLFQLLHLLLHHHLSLLLSVIYGDLLPILLMPGHPLLGTSENHSSSLLISLRHLTVSGIRLC